MPVAEAFALIADMRTFASWDPGIVHVDQVGGDGPGLDAAYDVQAAAFPRPLTLRYVTEQYTVPVDSDDPHEVLLVARGSLLTSVDRITVTATPDGSLIVYDADLRLNGLLRLADLGLRPGVRWIGGRFEDGLRQVTGGMSVPA
jgi:hypothetical protein